MPTNNEEEKSIIKTLQVFWVAWMLDRQNACIAPRACLPAAYKGTRSSGPKTAPKTNPDIAIKAGFDVIPAQVWKRLKV